MHICEALRCSAVVYTLPGPPQGVTAVAAACRQLRVLRCGALVHGASLDDDQLAVVASGSAEEGGTSIANEQMGLWDASNSFNSSSERVHQQQGALSSGQSTRGGGSGSGAEQPTRPSHAWQMSLVTKVSQLQLLDLGLHSGYTDVGLATLAYGCPQLRQVNRMDATGNIYTACVFSWHVLMGWDGWSRLVTMQPGPERSVLMATGIRHECPHHTTAITPTGSIISYTEPLPAAATAGVLLQTSSFVR